MKMVVAEFVAPDPMMRAARWAKEAEYPLLDAFTPYPVEGAAELLGASGTSLRIVMFLGGFLCAAFAYGIEGWSAIYNYPFDVGGRSLNSWPAFMLFPFAVAVAGAAIAGAVAFLWQTGLPRLHHPLFDIDGFERATQDRFILAFEGPVADDRLQTLVAWLKQAGAGRIWEIEP